MRQRSCRVCNGWHYLDSWPSECYVIPETKRSDLGFPMIGVRDDTEPLVSMADGKHYTSRAAMRESYKAPNNPKGVDYIEVGNDPEFIKPTPRQPLAPKKEDFLVAVEKAEAAINRGEFQDVP